MTFRTPVEPLANIGASAQVNAGSASARVALPAADRAVRLTATGNLRFAIGDGTVTAADAAGTSHYLSGGSVIELRLNGQTHVAAIRVGGTDAELHISALTY